MLRNVIGTGMGRTGTMSLKLSTLAHRFGSVLSRIGSRIETTALVA